MYRSDDTWQPFPQLHWSALAAWLVAEYSYCAELHDSMCMAASPKPIHPTPFILFCSHLHPLQATYGSCWWRRTNTE
jgi:hypothetical protein